MKQESGLLLADLLSKGSKIPNILLVRKIVDRTWIFFEFDEAARLWRVLPAGLAVMACFETPEKAFEAYQKTVPICRWSYESAASLITKVPATLLIASNKALNGMLSLEQIIERLRAGQPLIREGVGPRIIDVLSDPGK